MGDQEEIDGGPTRVWCQRSGVRSGAKGVLRRRSTTREAEDGSQNQNGGV